MDWNNIFRGLLQTGLTIAQVEVWANEKIRLLSSSHTKEPAMAAIAYEVANMDEPTRNYFKLHLGIKAQKSEMGNFLLSYFNYVITLEKNRIAGLLSANVQHAYEALEFDYYQGMDDFEIAAHYGLLSAYGQYNPRANSLTQAFGRLLNEG